MKPLRVIEKQPNARMCFVCGIQNGHGLQSRFYVLENNELMALFSPQKQHQGYPGRLHGGLAATILDEAIGRAIMIHHSGDVWGVTVDFSVRYRKPIPLDQEVKVISRITSEKRRTFEGTGEIILADGSVAIEGKGRYLKMDIEKIADFDHQGDDWQVVQEQQDPSQVQVPSLPSDGKSL